MFDLEKMNEVKSFIQNSSSESKIYFGSDSARYKKNKVWYARHTVCVIIHKDSSNGAKIFGYSEVEKDFDSKLSKPYNRMIAETEKAIELFKLLESVLGDKKVEIHLDINSDEEHGSNVAMGAALGYVQGMTNITPKFKPHAFAASHAADRAENW